MGRTVGISDYWNTRLVSWVASRIRKSKSECVEEGLKAIASKLDFEMETLKDGLERAKEIREEIAEDHE